MNKMQKLRSAAFALTFLIAPAFFNSPILSQVSPAARPTPTPAATPLAVASPTPAPAVIQTVSDLTAKIRARLLRPEVRRGQVGIKIVSLASGRTASASIATTTCSAPSSAAC